MARAQSASFSGRGKPPYWSTVVSNLYGVDSLTFHWVETSNFDFGRPHRFADPAAELFVDIRTRYPFRPISTVVRKGDPAPYMRVQPWNPRPEEPENQVTCVYAPWMHPSGYKPPHALGYIGDSTPQKRKEPPLPELGSSSEFSYKQAITEILASRVKRVKLNDESLEKAGEELRLVQSHIHVLSSQVQSLSRRMNAFPREVLPNIAAEVQTAVGAAVKPLVDGISRDVRDALIPLHVDLQAVEDRVRGLDPSLLQSRNSQPPVEVEGLDPKIIEARRLEDAKIAQQREKENEDARTKFAQEKAAKDQEEAARKEKEKEKKRQEKRKVMEANKAALEKQQQRLKEQLEATALAAAALDTENSESSTEVALLVAYRKDAPGSTTVEYELNEKTYTAAEVFKLKPLPSDPDIQPTLDPSIHFKIDGLVGVYSMKDLPSR